MTTHKEALTLALEALEKHKAYGTTYPADHEAITAIKEALAQQGRIEKQMGEIIKSLRCPNCDSLERQNAELDLRLAEQDQAPFGFLTNKRQRITFEPNATGLSNMPMTIDWKIPLYGSPQPKEPEQEPVAWQERQAKRMQDGVVTEWTNWYPCRYRTIDEAKAEACDHIPYEWRPLYTTPPQRKPSKEHALYETFAKIAAYLEIDTEAAQSAAGKPSDVFIEAIKKREAPQRKPLTGDALLSAAQSCLSPSQYDHFEALIENDQDAHNRLARAIENERGK